MNEERSRAAGFRPLVALILLMAVVAVLVAVIPGADSVDPIASAGGAGEAPADRPKVLLVEAYHPEYDWTRQVLAGVDSVIPHRIQEGGSVLSDMAEVDLEILFLDTKRKKDEVHAKNAAQQALTFIETWKPDLVISGDDNVAKHLVLPYLKGGSIPVVFYGINWDASVYGFPCENVTGMVEVSLIDQAMEMLLPHADGARLGVLCSDTVSERRTAMEIKKLLESPPTVRFAKSMADLKQGFLELQEACDLLMINEILSVEGFDPEAMLEFALQHTEKPTGTTDAFLKNYVLLTCAKSGVEHGRWAARTSLDILAGKAVSDIPLAQNVDAQLVLNIPLAKKLNIVFPFELVDQAALIHPTFPEEAR